MSITISGSGTISGLSAGGLPSATVTQATLATPVAGTGPAFSAYQSSAQTLGSATFTKLTFTTEEFDTNSNYDTATSRFTPTVAGYYQINTCATVSTSATTATLEIYKNGSLFKRLTSILTSSSSISGSALVYLNGSTDYVEVYLNISIGQALVATSAYTYFQGSLVRSA